MNIFSHEKFIIVIQYFTGIIDDYWNIPYLLYFKNKMIKLYNILLNLKGSV